MTLKIASANRIRFTEAVIARMKPPETGSYIRWDSTTPTLGIRVAKTGLKTWLRGNRRLGHWPKMSLMAARALMAGDAPTLTTFFSLASSFLEHGRTRRGRPLRANTLGQYRRLLLSGPAKTLHQQRFGEISRADIAQLTRRVATQNGAPMASLLKAVLGRLWSYAIEIGEADYNVVTGSPGYTVAKRARVLTDVELAALWHASENDQAYGLIIRLLLWTGCRRSEAGGLRWSELAGGWWRIPPRRAKNDRELLLPLASQTLDALGRWPRIVGQDCLFGPRGFTGWSRAKRRLDARLQFSQPWMTHDLRRSTESRLAQLGISKEIRDRLLNHDIGDIQESYQHYDFMPEKRAALQQWADAMEHIVEQRPAVVAIKG